MPQLQLPMFPVGVTPITSLLAFIKEEGNITYFNGSLPVFSHQEEDTQSFRMITAQFCVNGHTQQAEIARAFGVTPISVKRSVKLYRKEGARGFYKQKKQTGSGNINASCYRAGSTVIEWARRGRRYCLKA
jgi:hypothetical protein